jgi:hypothetical protein
MKALILLSLVSLAIVAPAGFAAAATSDYSDVDVISVIPRSPDIKPLVMSISPQERRELARHADVNTGAARIQPPAHF